jgi:hypothetical protein
MRQLTNHASILSVNTTMPGLTPSDKTKRASMSITVEWTSTAGKEAPVSIIPKSFLKSCLSNLEDGMQDYILWDDSEQSGDSASSSENECATEDSLDELSD